jgi:hypothetical protein
VDVSEIERAGGCCRAGKPIDCLVHGGLFGLAIFLCGSLVFSLTTHMLLSDTGIAPVNRLTAEFAAGPNPEGKSSDTVNFFNATAAA